MVGLIVYASVQAHLDWPLAFPGDYTAWDKEFCQSSATLNAHMYEWAALSDGTKNEAFNVQDGLPFTWSRFWPFLAAWYGTHALPPASEEGQYQTHLSRAETPPRGYGPRGQTRCTFSFLEWSIQPMVENVWNEIKAEHDLLLDPFKDREQIFGITDSAVIGGWPLSLSMRKARKMGWLGTCDSYESMFWTMKEFVVLKMSPPLAVEEFSDVVPDVLKL